MELCAPCAALDKLAVLVPRSLNDIVLPLVAAGRSDDGFEGVRFAGEVALAFVFDVRDIATSDNI